MKQYEVTDFENGRWSVRSIVTGYAIPCITKDLATILDNFEDIQQHKEKLEGKNGL